MDYSLEYKIKKAFEFENAGKILHAMQIYNSLVKEFPDLIDSFIRLASLYEKTGQVDSAVEIIKQGIRLNPKNSELLLNSGQFFIRNKLWRDTVEVLKDISPEEEPIVSLLVAHAYFNLEEHELAKIHLLQFIISDEQPELIHEAYLFLAKIEYFFNNLDSALKYISKAELLLNDFWELHFIKAKVLFKQKMYSHSIKAIESAIRVNSKEEGLHSWAGKIYIKGGEYEKAESHLIKFMQLQKSVSVEIYLALADTFQMQNKFLEAKQFLNEALKLHPENPDISKRIKLISNIINSTKVSDA